MEHTKTPYEIVKAPTNEYGFRFEIMSGNHNVAILSTRPESEANAEFIVKACNNYDKLVDLLRKSKASVWRDKPLGDSLNSEIETLLSQIDKEAKWVN